jgi:alpha-N-arabinofuranosidase
MLRLIAKVVAVTCSVVLIATQSQFVVAQSNTIIVQVDKPGAGVPATLYGLFFEDINFGADGGLYPERVKNRSFEFPDAMMAWQKLEREGANGTVDIKEDSPLSAKNPHYLRLATNAKSQGFGVMNEGFRGIGIQQGKSYVFSVYARRQENGPTGLRIELEDGESHKLGSVRLGGFTSAWKKYTVEIRPTSTSLKAHLNVFVEGPGSLDVDMVSLMPKDLWLNRPNGLRPDLVQLLKDMKPGFLRFPGGCIVEGRYLSTRYQWKTTIGDIIDRHLIINRWNDEFKHKPAPDYYQSFGLGFYEYFLLSEDIGAEPLPILNCGMACQFNSNELAPLDDLDPYIQDALDLIDFANSPATTDWGRTRATLGHPAPFNLKMIGVGNEQWGPQYIERYKLFAKVLKEKHPEITLVTPAGPSPNDERFQFLWANLRALNADIVDEHYYMAPKWFRDNVCRYDDYPRTGPKVFAGEYAAQSAGVARPDNRNNWECALSEAAFMTGLQRNADVVRMASYAPLFAHVDAWQWTPDLIWFDNLRSYGTPNYYVQKLFSLNKGTTILPVLMNGSAKNGQGDLFTSASLDTPANEIVVTIVNADASAKSIRINLAGARGLKKTGKVFVLATTDLKAENSLAEPMKVAPVEKQLQVPASEFVFEAAPNSVNVLRVGVGGS